MTYAQYGHRTQSGCLYVWLQGGLYVPLTVEPMEPLPDNLESGEELEMILRLYAFSGRCLTTRRSPQEQFVLVDEKRNYSYAGKFGNRAKEDFKSIVRLSNCLVVGVAPVKDEENKLWYRIDLLYEHYYILHAVAGDGFGEYGIHKGDEFYGRFAILGEIRRRRN